MTGTQKSPELGQVWGYYGTGTTKPECHLPAVVHLLSLLHKWEGELAVAQTESETEQSKGLLFSLVKKFSASAISLLAGSANPPGLLLGQNLALWFGKARGDPAPSKLIWSLVGFPTYVSSLPANRSLPAMRQRTGEGHHCRRKSPWLSCANSPGQDLPWSLHMQSSLRSRRV